MNSREEYADRKARSVCVDCQAPSPRYVRCLDCRERHRVYRKREDKKHPEVVAARMKRLYWKNPEHFRAQKRQYRLEKKLRGECLKCPEEAADGNNHCPRHIVLESKRGRDWRERKKLGGPLKKGGVKARPANENADEILTNCACGAAKDKGAVACSRCQHLDGHSRLGEVIGALRGTDGLSLRELCEELGMNSDLNNGTRQMWRWVKQLMESGRIRRFWREDSAGKHQMESYRNGETARDNAVGCWAYALDGKTEREWKAA